MKIYTIMSEKIRERFAIRKSDGNIDRPSRNMILVLEQDLDADTSILSLVKIEDSFSPCVGDVFEELYYTRTGRLVGGKS